MTVSGLGRVAPTSAVEASAASNIPTFSTESDPPSIRFSGHPHTLTITGEQLAAAAASSTVTEFPVGGGHSHVLQMSPAQAKTLIETGRVRIRDEDSHVHFVTFRAPESQRPPADPVAPPAPPSGPVTAPGAPAFPREGVQWPHELQFFMRTSVDGRYVACATSNEELGMLVRDTQSNTTFAFPFGIYDPSWAKGFLYFQGLNEDGDEMCFVIKNEFFEAQAKNPGLLAIRESAPKVFDLDWFKANAPDAIFEIPGILVYQDLPTDGGFALQFTGGVWDQGNKPPDNDEYVPSRSTERSFGEKDEIVLTPVMTPNDGFRFPTPFTGNGQLNDIGDRVIAQRVTEVNGEKRDSYVIYAIDGAVEQGGSPKLRELMSFQDGGSKADMLGHNLVAYERRAGAASSEIVVRNLESGKERIVAPPKDGRVYKFPHFNVGKDGEGASLSFVEQNWTKNGEGEWTGARNVVRRVPIEQ